MQTIETIDSHTGGEPTRVVIRGGPALRGATMAQKASDLARRADWLRTALILEPRGSDWVVGALLQESSIPECTAGVIFFNNVGLIGMCGHGLMGVVESLAFQGRIAPGEHRFETPVGIVSARRHDDRSVTIENVTSFRYRRDVPVDVPGLGTVRGDIAYGGNWFFLSQVDPFEASDLESLLDRSRKIRTALDVQEIRGKDGAEIDHVELFGPPGDPAVADSRNFVLCPGGQYDRSPCGTGTSAKLACLAADGLLEPGQIWRQESIIGSRFEGRYRTAGEGITPQITGRAFVTGENKWLLDDDDPFRLGIGIEV